MSRPDSWMPFYWGDYFRDTRRLSTLEHGAYMLLIGEYWVSGRPLPDDDATLARLAVMPERDWAKVRSVLAPFFTVSNGQWRQKRIEEELAKANARYEQRVTAARTSAQARAKHPLNERPTDAPTTVTPPVPTGNERKPTQPQPHLPNGKSSEAKASDAEASADELLDIPLNLIRPIDGDYRKVVFGPALDFVVKETKLAPKAARALLGKWLGMAGDDDRRLLGLLGEAQGMPVRADLTAWMIANLGGKKNGAKRDDTAARRGGIAGAFAERYGASGGGLDADPPEGTGGETGADVGLVDTPAELVASGRILS